MDVREKLVEQLREVAGLTPPICEYQKPEETELFGKNVMVYCKPFEQFQELLREAADYIAHGVTVQEWISVKDRLPPYNHDVLVYRPNMAMKIMVDSYNGYYGEDDNEWYEGWSKYGKDIHNNPLITHWAFLPQPPKGE